MPRGDRPGPIRRAVAWVRAWFKPTPPMPGPWPPDDALLARLLLAEERLYRTKMEIQFLRSQIRQRDADDRD
jgi:hypothetical protein